MAGRPMGTFFVVSVVFLIFCSGVSCYFIASAVYGSSGLLHIAKLKGEVDSISFLVGSIRSERDRLLLLVRGVKEETIDVDLMDERARVVLGCIAPGESVFFCSSGCFRDPVVFDSSAISFAFSRLAFFAMCPHSAGGTSCGVV